MKGVNVERQNRPPRVAATILLALLVTATYLAALWSSQRTVTCTVESKDRTSWWISDSRVFKDARITTDCGVFRVADTIVGFHFESDDRYAEIDEEQTYRFDIQGWGLPILPVSPNITKAEAASN